MTDTMKKVLKCVLFIAGLAAILFVLSLVFFPKNNEKKDGIIDVAANAILGEPENTIDVLIIGDSESINAINPLRIWDQHGIASYCCGTSLQLLSYSEYFLHQAFKSQSPKIVILETNEIFREVTLDDLLLHQLEMVFPVFSFHSRWKVLSFRDISPVINYTHVDVEKGYYFSTVVSGTDESDYMKEMPGEEPIPSINMFYLRKIKSFCKEKGVKLVLVSTPSVVNWDYMKHNSIQRISEEEGIEFIDMNLLRKEIPIDWKTDTRDRGDHVNYYGAEKVSAYLGKYLSETGLFESHRSDPAYSQWDVHLKEFNERTEQPNSESGS